LVAAFNAFFFFILAHWDCNGLAPSSGFPGKMGVLVKDFSTKYAMHTKNIRKLVFSRDHGFGELELELGDSLYRIRCSTPQMLVLQTLAEKNHQTTFQLVRETHISHTDRQRLGNLLLDLCHKSTPLCRLEHGDSMSVMDWTFSLNDEFMSTSKIVDVKKHTHTGFDAQCIAKEVKRLAQQVELVLKRRITNSIIREMKIRKTYPRKTLVTSIVACYSKWGRTQHEVELIIDELITAEYLRLDPQNPQQCHYV